MNLLLIVSALAGFASAIGHAYLGERFVLRPLFGGAGENRILAIPYMRRLLRWVWHLPSFAWAQIALATLWFASGHSGDPSSQTLLLYFGIGIYMTGALFNALAMRGPHVGNILLTIAAAALWFGLTG